jgi:hypothetical protein
MPPRRQHKALILPVHRVMTLPGSRGEIHSYCVGGTAAAPPAVGRTRS